MTTVLIESDWNLKCLELKKYKYVQDVLIESDWNLKEADKSAKRTRKEVLIESDWNLKNYNMEIFATSINSINRIRLEFKDL